MLKKHVFPYLKIDSSKIFQNDLVTTAAWFALIGGVLVNLGAVWEQSLGE